MIQFVNFNREKLDEIQNILKVATTKCSDYYSRANYIGFKRPLAEESRDRVPSNSIDCISRLLVYNGKYEHFPMLSHLFNSRLI